MNSEACDRVFENQVKECLDTLRVKEAEYAEDFDRLHNFKVSARVQGVIPIQALGGMMVKHTTSIYDLIRNEENYSASPALWHEKITDHINYLLLLRALLQEKWDGDETVSGTKS